MIFKEAVEKRKLCSTKMEIVHFPLLFVLQRTWEFSCLFLNRPFLTALEIFMHIFVCRERIEKRASSGDPSQSSVPHFRKTNLKSSRYNIEICERKLICYDLFALFLSECKLYALASGQASKFEKPRGLGEKTNSKHSQQYVCGSVSLCKKEKEISNKRWIHLRVN
ncbi:hypothetical protein MKW98_009463 [Papaver atlanticum]|uniref:Uncharacterized protein n=1 Tax=Papaver atlanticum TaxID=357466 RepID=A0AAD4XEE1_9MAGN|nr:hypothetical protein MKW98_009463 [Papaver atlanticum]